MSLTGKLDQEELRAYARRDWQAPEQSVERKVELAIALYEGARESLPGWPNEDIRRADLVSHLCVCALLDRAAHVGTR